MKKLVLFGVVALLSGCLQVFPILPFLQAHQAQVVIVGATAGAAGAVLGAADNAVKLEKDIVK